MKAERLIKTETVYAYTEISEREHLLIRKALELMISVGNMYFGSMPGGLRGRVTGTDEREARNLLTTLSE